MRHVPLIVVLCLFTGCANQATLTTIERGTPWDQIEPAAKKHGYHVGDTSAMATSGTLFGEPPGITLALENDRVLIIYPDAAVRSVVAMKIMGNARRPKAYRTWEYIKAFDLASGTHVSAETRDSPTEPQ